MRFMAVAGGLLLLIPLTWMFREVRSARIEKAPQVYRGKVVSAALDRIDRDFGVMQRDLFERAGRIVSAPEVMEALAAQEALANPDSAALAQYFSAMAVPYGTSVELYTPEMELVAWNGFSMPMDTAPDLAEFPAGLHTGIAQDGAFRQAIVAWRPITRDIRVLGVVRAMRLVEYAPPVHNEYIKDVSLVPKWRRLAKLPVELTFDVSIEEAAPFSRLLQGVDGTVLGLVTVGAPSIRQMTALAAVLPNHLMALWTALFFFWTLGGMWRLYRREIRRLQAKPSRNRWWAVIGGFAMCAVYWWSLRFILLEMNVPSRWQQGKTPLAPLFDPTHLSSGLFGGALGSTGELLITILFLVAFSGAFLEWVGALRKARDHLFRPRRISRMILAGVAAACTGILAGLLFLPALVARHVALHSTFDFFAKGGLIPDLHLLVVFCSLVLMQIGVILLAAGVTWVAVTEALHRLPPRSSSWTFGVIAGFSVAAPLVAVYMLTPIGTVLPLAVLGYMLAAVFGLVCLGMLRSVQLMNLITLRNLFPLVFLVTFLLYPMFYLGLDASRHVRMIAAAEAFAQGEGPRVSFAEGGTPISGVLLPSGSNDALFDTFSGAEFHDGILFRSTGRDFERYRLPEDVMQALLHEPAVWRNERLEGGAWRSYYMRGEPAPAMDSFPGAMQVFAVRAPHVTLFDHLYYLLRLTMGGLVIALLCYLAGVRVRHRRGLLPAPHIRFRDKVLNALIGIGIILVGLVGVVGEQAVTVESRQSVQRWLHRHLDRVEQVLAAEARPGERPSSVLDRMPIDSLAARVGIDLNVYEGHTISRLSRPQLIRDRLVDRRLPIEAYKALYTDADRVTFTDERVGSFTYMAGFRAFVGEEGSPRYVVSTPILPEQEIIEEERADTVAYLFGSLLLLVLLVVLTGLLLANAISKPIARLRSGLKAVAVGRFGNTLPVDSRDEIGKLVETFNEMQQQLSESQIKLARQERQLAWREMARQVAHEIRNPLTPMKLSVQHLRQAFADRVEGPDARSKFGQIFDRITGTLIEQIDSLARIASEFHAFARMPSREMQRIDMNDVIREAVSLMQEESEIGIRSALSEAPLFIGADRAELRRTYINLIKNALQAISAPETGRVEVRTELEEVAGKVWGCSYVVDNGSGIEEAVGQEIFEPHFSTKTSGTGLGLAIVKKSVEEMRGTIGFTTEVGKGTVFQVRFPLIDDSATAS